MAKRLDKKPRSIIYALIAQRDGEYCISCFAEGAGRRGPNSGYSLELDHADNDPKNWDPDNLHLCCKTHNLKFRRLTTKQHISLLREHSAVNVCVKAREGKDPRRQRVLNEVDIKAGSTELLLNSIYEPTWLDFMHRELRERGSMTKKDAINGGAAECTCSNSTTARYYEVHTSFKGEFEEFTDGSGHRCVRYRHIDIPGTRFN